MDQIYTTTATKTKAITGTHLAVATLVALGAAGLAYIATLSTSDGYRIKGGGQVGSSAKYYCSDSDGGKVETVAGVAQIKDGINNLIRTETDTCITSSTIVEYYCNKAQTSVISSTTINCAGGSVCLAGACTAPLAPTTTYSCVDDDNGQDIFTRASTTVTDDNTGKKVFAHGDTCLGGTVVLEGYCTAAKGFDSQMLASTVSSSCPANFGCKYGECRKITDLFRVQIDPISPTPGNMLTMAVGAGTQIGKFKITNLSAAPVTITSFKLSDSGAHTGASTTYRMSFSSENGADYLANLFDISATDFVNGSYHFPNATNTMRINSGAYRFVTVSINAVGGINSGDAFRLGVAAEGDVLFSLNELDANLDMNGDGDWGDTFPNLQVFGAPTLGTVVKQ